MTQVRTLSATNSSRSERDIANANSAFRYAFYTALMLAGIVFNARHDWRYAVVAVILACVVLFSAGRMIYLFGKVNGRAE